MNAESAQYSWTTQPTTVFLPKQKLTRISLKSEGDYPLVVSGIDLEDQLAKTKVRWTTCIRVPLATRVTEKPYGRQGVCRGGRR